MNETTIYDFSPQAAQVDFSKYLIDLSQATQEPQPLICVADKPLFTRGNISSISGQAKSRKTFLIGLFAAQFLDLTDSEKIIIFDTEQAIFHVQKSTKRVHKILEWNDKQNDERLKVFALRELETAQRKEFVIKAINHYKPDLVFIDGVRDLLNDFNNIAESSEIVNALMRLSSENNCHICAVLHENKGNNSLRGHAGTELQNKSESVISVEADGDVSVVSPKYCRNIPFDKFYFRINENGLPEYCNHETKPKNTDKLKELFVELLPENVTLNYAEMRNKVMGKCKVTDRTAERRIKSATEQGIIIKNAVGNYHLPTEIEQQSECPY